MLQAVLVDQDEEERQIEAKVHAKRMEVPLPKYTGPSRGTGVKALFLLVVSFYFLIHWYLLWMRYISKRAHILSSLWWKQCHTPGTFSARELIVPWIGDYLLSCGVCE